jgi:hypothetical protein
LPRPRVLYAEHHRNLRGSVDLSASTRAAHRRPTRESRRRWISIVGVSALVAALAITAVCLPLLLAKGKEKTFRLGSLRYAASPDAASPTPTSPASDSPTPGSSAASASSAPPTTPADAPDSYAEVGRYSIAIDGMAVFGRPDGKAPSSAGTLDASEAGADGAQTLSLADSAGQLRFDVTPSQDGVSLSRLQVTNPAYNAAFSSSSGAVLVPASPHAGDKWSWYLASNAGDTHLSGHLQFERVEQIRVGPSSVRALVLSFRWMEEGTVNATMSGLMWWAPSLGLPVRLQVVASGSAGGQEIQEDVIDQLTSATPP